MAGGTCSLRQGWDCQLESGSLSHGIRDQRGMGDFAGSMILMKDSFYDFLADNIRGCVLQVSVAALLDNFISASAEMELDEKLQQAKACVRDHLERNPMEPLLIKLAREFTDNQDLSDRLLKLYKVLQRILYC